MQEVRHSLARLLVVLRRHLAQVVHTAVDVRIPMGIGFHDGIQHHLRLLTRCRVIQIYQALAVHLLVQYGKIGDQSGQWLVVCFRSAQSFLIIQSTLKIQRSGTHNF